jgi:hypothetical protein
MTGRSELDELNALAESISADAKGWRERRRERSAEHRERRFHSESQAPRLRRWRHRLFAITAVLLIGVGFGTWGVISHQENKVPKAAPPKPVTSVPGYSLPYVKAGRVAAEKLTSQGLTLNEFDCEGWYETNRLGDVAGQAGPVWHEGFMRSCLTTPANTTGTG